MVVEIEYRLEECDRILEKDPQSKETWRRRAEALRRMGKQSEALESVYLALQALESVEQALRINPNWERAWRTKGDILRDLGKDEEALTCYERGLEICPNDAVLWENRGDVLTELGQLDAAQRSYELARGDKLARMDLDLIDRFHRLRFRSVCPHCNGSGQEPGSKSHMLNDGTVYLSNCSSCQGRKWLAL